METIEDMGEIAGMRGEIGRLREDIEEIERDIKYLGEQFIEMSAHSNHDRIYNHSDYYYGLGDIYQDECMLCLGFANSEDGHDMSINNAYNYKYSWGYTHKMKMEYLKDKENRLYSKIRELNDRIYRLEKPRIFQTMDGRIYIGPPSNRSYTAIVSPSSNSFTFTMPSPTVVIQDEIQRWDENWNPVISSDKIVFNSPAPKSSFTVPQTKSDIPNIIKPKANPKPRKNRNPKTFGKNKRRK